MTNRQAYFAWKIAGSCVAIGACYALLQVSFWALIGVLGWSLFKVCDEVGDTFWKDQISDEARQSEGKER